MQNFLPYGYPDFMKTARCLDNRRLGKQRVETLQCLDTLTGNSPKRGWAHHPAVRMWKGHEAALATYGLFICDEWRARGFNPGVSEPRMQEYWRELRRYRKLTKMPPWMGDERLHFSHRELLEWKDPDHYNFEDIPEEAFDKPDVFWPTRHPDYAGYYE
jgi:hypothetical protein